jgi:hypothetical protein
MNFLFDFFLLLVGAFLGVVAMALASANGRSDEREELAKLRAFAQDILEDWPDVGYLDGFDLQELAHKHGLLVSETRYQRCGEFCSCAEVVENDEWAEGVTCFRKTALLKGGAV